MVLYDFIMLHTTVYPKRHLKIITRMFISNILIQLTISYRLPLMDPIKALSADELDNNNH